MHIVFATLTVLGGLVAALAGGHGLRQTRRITGDGHLVMALVKQPSRDAQRPLLEFKTRDGRVMEIVSPVAELTVGTSVGVSYDPRDPRDVVVDGHRRTGVDRGFVIVGLLLMVIGLVLAVSGL
ncbi:DUF3592 domain-containing protein [Streptomyces sp. NPDC096193]|uniref:DUF3592 domain-containing protein n=1 Tax=Streptomyces sp. NPDC096193 TaxID=3155821 RepID=UPI003322C26E